MNETAIKEQTTATSAIEALISGEETKNLPGLEVIKGALQNNVISLGENEAFALRDGDGDIRAFRQRVTLSLKDKTLVQIPGGDIVVSAQGYEVWAEAAGANVIFPDQVLVGPKHEPNPYAIYDEKNGRPKIVHARAVAFRFSSKGIPQVCDWSTTFDAASYRMQDLLAKAKQKPQAFRLLPEGVDPPESENATWGKYIFDEIMCLWINSSHEEALKWYSNIINREKKAMDFAQTFARRNALKHLSGIQKAPGPVWNMSVLCWRPTSGNIIKWDATQYIQLKKRVGNLIHAQDEFETKQIEANVGHDHAEDEDTAILDTELDPEDRKADAEVSGSEERTTRRSSEYTDEDHQALQSIAVIMEEPEFDAVYEKACKQLGVVEDSNHSPETARKLLEAIKAISDAE